MTHSTQRQAQVAAAIDNIRAIHHAHGIDRQSLVLTANVLEGLAAQPELFSLAAFPVPTDPLVHSARYPLHQDADGRYALYLNVQKPGKNSVPHDHKTWAVIVAIQGEELNRQYRRLDDGSDPHRAQLTLERELSVKPGVSAAYLGDDIHSIHVSGEQPTLHFHLYGRALETLTERVAFDLENGTVANYNQNHYRPSQPVVEAR